MEETINILCATDNNYAPYCGIMLTSLFESNKDFHFVAFVFEDGSVSEENANKYQRLAKKYGNEIVLKTIDESMVKGFPLKDNTYITLPTYYRLLAAELLPEAIHKIIYLDCDIIVKGDLKSLFYLNLDNLALAGVEDCNPFLDEQCSRLGYARLFSYFNAGVLVFNLDYWRNNCLSEKVFRFIHNNCNILPVMDQDVLNRVLYGEKALLPARFNYMTGFFWRECWNKYSSERQQHCIEEIETAVIIHYVGGQKPWDYRSYGGPFFSLWEECRRKSLWRDCLCTNPLKKHVKHMVKRYLFPDLFRKQHHEWVVVAENKRFYRDCVL